MNIGSYVLIPRNNPKKSIHLNITKDTDPQKHVDGDYNKQYIVYQTKMYCNPPNTFHC